MGTSKEMMDKVVSMVEKGAHVLEPSAGTGTLARALGYHGCIVDCVELNKDNFTNLEHLKDCKIIRNIYKGDFLKLVDDIPLHKKEYDYVIGISPYRNNIDCQHIMAMYKCVRTGGRVISYTLPYWTTGIYSNQMEFRKWLSDKSFTIEFIEDKSYALCPKALLVIQK